MHKLSVYWSEFCVMYILLSYRTLLCVGTMLRFVKKCKRANDRIAWGIQLEPMFPLSILNYCNSKVYGHTQEKTSIILGPPTRGISKEQQTLEHRLVVFCFLIIPHFAYLNTDTFRYDIPHSLKYCGRFTQMTKYGSWPNKRVSFKSIMQLIYFWMTSH